MAKPFFSLIIPTLNEEKYLPSLLIDLSAQTFRDFEVIVVDGKSVDQTVKKAKALSRHLPRFKLLTSSRRHVCTQRNLGARRARADTLVFLDADNSLPPYFFQGLKYRLESDPTDLATCWLKSDNNSTKDRNIAHAMNLAAELSKNTTSAVVMEGLIVITRQAYNLLEGFDESVDFAEGRALLQKANKRHLKYCIYKDPIYTTSFRRLREQGTLSLAGNLAQHELARLFNIPISQAKISELYPMQGGNLYQTPANKRHRFATKIATLFLEFKNPASLKRRLKSFLKE